MRRPTRSARRRSATSSVCEPASRSTTASYSWLVNPSYQLTDDVLLYASASAGEKSGAVQFDTADGSPQNVEPEKSLNFEVGVKS